MPSPSLLVSYIFPEGTHAKCQVYYSNHLSLYLPTYFSGFPNTPPTLRYKYLSRAAAAAVCLYINSGDLLHRWLALDL